MLNLTVNHVEVCIQVTHSHWQLELQTLPVWQWPATGIISVPSMPWSGHCLSCCLCPTSSAFLVANVFSTVIMSFLGLPVGGLQLTCYNILTLLHIVTYCYSYSSCARCDDVTCDDVTCCRQKDSTTTHNKQPWPY